MQRLLINNKETIYEALVKLNSIEEDVSRLILFVENDKNEIIGSLTDGDIRRFLIKNKNLDQSVDTVCNKNFTFIVQSPSYISMEEYRKRNIKMLPVLNNENRLVKIINLDKVKAVLPLECVVMAGGRGKRLSPLTDKKPKPMLVLGDLPIIEHNINRLITFGIEKIYISVKYLGQQIVDYFGDGSAKGISIEYIWEDKPLGTAGAMSLVKNYNSDHVLLLNSDVFTNINFEDLYLSLLENNADMAVASTEYKVDIPYAVFETNGNYVKAFKEKPSYIYQSNAGIYILKRELIREIPKNKFYDITDLMEKISSEGRKLVFNPIVGYWIDIGRPSDYEYAQNFIKHLHSS